MSLLNLQGTTVALANGVALPQVQEQSVLFVTRLKEVAKLGDEITIAHLLLLEQAGWVPATKGNFSGLEGWLNQLYQGNKTLYSKCVSWLKANAGLAVEIRDKAGEEVATYAVISVVADVDQAKIASNFSEAIANGVRDGILMGSKPRKAPKASAGKGGAKNSNVVEVDPRVPQAEELGILDVISSPMFADIKEDLAALLAHVLQNPNQALVKQQLQSTVTKLNNGFKLGAAMAKAG